MIIKKFQGKTEEEAVLAARKELGQGVVVLNAKQVKPRGLFGAFRPRQTEVTVALEEESIPSREEVRKKATPTAAGGTNPNRVSVARLSDSGSGEATASIEQKLDSLQTLLVNQIQKNAEVQTLTEETSKGLPKPEKEEEKESLTEEELAAAREQEKLIRLLYNTMLENEVDEKNANSILENLERNKKSNIPMDYLLANVYQKMILKFGKADGIRSAGRGVMVVIFLGPTGVGKTTTIAKLASEFVMAEKKKVALLTTDTYRIAAAEQLRTYANILEVPFRVIYTGEELTDAVESFKEYDYILVDTAGHSQKNEEQMDKMKGFLEAIPEGIEYQSFLVLSATTKYRDLISIADSYQKIVPDYQLIFTKTDETDALGNLMNLKLYTDVPIAYLTNGQNVPDDIEEFNAQKIVKQLLAPKD